MTDKSLYMENLSNPLQIAVLTTNAISLFLKQTKWKNKKRAFFPSNVICQTFPIMIPLFLPLSPFHIRLKKKYSHKSRKNVIKVFNVVINPRVQVS